MDKRGIIYGSECRAAADAQRAVVAAEEQDGGERDCGLECRASAERRKKKEDSEESSLLIDACCGYAADLDIKSLYVTDPNVPSVVVFSAPASSTYLMTSFASTA